MIQSIFALYRAYKRFAFIKEFIIFPAINNNNFIGDLQELRQPDNKSSPNKQKRITPKKQSNKNDLSDEEMEIIVAAGQDSKLTRSLKAVQEEYQRFAAMKMRSFTSNASGDMANPGTEVTINCVIVFVSDNIPIIQVYAVDLKWIDQWKLAATSVGGSSSGTVSSKLASI